MPAKINYNIFFKIYLLFYFSIMMIFIGLTPPAPQGEWDDYCLVTASIINEGNITVSHNDIEKAKKIFPEWDAAIDNYTLSGYTSKNGGEMSWYFPTYSLLCVPLVLLLKFLRLPAIYAFGFTNLFLLILLNCIIIFKCKTKNANKRNLILLLTLNPIVFYLPWISAEVCIYSLLGISMVFWINKEYNQAAFFISLAGTLNPAILIIGIFMIIEYIYTLWRECPGKGLKKNVRYLILKWKKIGVYGCCFIIALVPFIYNYYNTGHLNLTASYTGFTQDKTRTIARFWSYIFDWNFGLLPYYSFLLLLAILLIFWSIIKRNWKYIQIMLSFFSLVYIYSLMTHINSGMSGISRYNAWSAVVMIFAVCIYAEKTISDKQSVLPNICIAITVIISSVILYIYGPMYACNTYYTNMTPIATCILDNIPYLYNPLPSTFNSRLNHIDGGYNYDTPIVYYSSNGEVRKVLASKKDSDYLKKCLTGSVESTFWLYEQLKKLESKEEYISIPHKYHLYMSPQNGGQ